MIIATGNFKGGVAKSSTVLNLGTSLAGRNYKVLYVDADPQGNLSDSLAAPAGHAGLYEVLAKGKAITACRTHYKYFDLLQSSYTLLGLSGRAKIKKALLEALEPVSKEYDFILLDLAPAMTDLVLACLDTADKIIVPLQANSYCAKGLTQFFTVADPQKVAGVLLCMQRKTTMAEQFTDAIKEIAEKNGTILFNTQVRLCNKVPEAEALHMNLYDYAPHSNAAIDYGSFTDELLERVKK